jgi:ubiquinone/menaquinone biosynthesis C-methylase UbiE
MNDPINGAGRTTAYALGHSQRELERLGAQARVIEPITRQFFRDAGIVPGMHVLDVGSGAGDVAFLAADLVGPAGKVIGTDRSPAAIAAALKQAEARSLDNVSFREGDPSEMTFEQRFDAVVGRYVLMFQADPAATLRKLAAHLRPGGLVVFHEPSWDGVRSFPPSPTYDRCWQWIVDTFERVGTEMRMGLKLYATFIAAGLPAPSMRLSAVIGGGSSDWLNVIAENVRSLLPEMERLGVATAAEVGIEVLADRLRKEVAASGGVIVGRSEIAAWSRVRA